MKNYPDSQKLLARPYRKAVLKALLVITIVSGFLFAYLNVGRQNYSLAAVELLMSFYSMFIFWAVSRPGVVVHMEGWILAYVLPFFTAMMVALASPISTPSVFVWALLIPLLSHLLMGKRWGLLISIGFMMAAAVIFVIRFQHDPDLMQPVPIANFSILTCVILAFSYVYEITREQTETGLLAMAHFDPLTGLANRARLSSVFNHEQLRCQRTKSPLSIVLLDLDHFKGVNDTYGHEVGDLALKHFSEIFKKSLRKTDLAARMGGEEFCILLPDTDGEQALVVADKVRQAFEREALVIEGGSASAGLASIQGSTSVQLTLSGGVAEYGVDGRELSDLIRIADYRLYGSKNQGRNQITLGDITDPAVV